MASPALRATLLPYQQEAVTWCASRESECCILAYDMGLGKTVISCGLLVEKPMQTLIMVPTSLLDQWKSEIEQHTTGLNVCIYHGSNRKYKSARETAKKADVILTTASVIANDIHNSNYHFRSAKRWIIDEAHKLRNSKTKAFKSLHLYAQLVENKVFLTGTPVCNSCDDIISLVCLSNLEGYNQQDYWKGLHASTKYKRLHKISEQIILRKTKAETIQDILPEIKVTEFNLEVDSGLQKDTYNYFLADSLVLRKILRMRQSLNNHQQLIQELDELDIFKDDDTDEDTDDDTAAASPKTLLQTGQDNAATSTKLLKAVDIVNGIPSEDKIIIFSYFTKLLRQIYSVLPIPKESIHMYHGGLTTAERTEVINSFKSDPTARVLLINLRAGGTGLNLVEANHVILMEPYWNDAEEQQAINRCYRIGQKKPVFVYKLAIENSIEGWLLRLKKSKNTVTDFLISKNSQVKTADIKDEQNRVKQFFRFVKDLKIDENTQKEVDVFLSM
jgi:SNF2 family DNA or RNA helicase